PGNDTEDCATGSNACLLRRACRRRLQPLGNCSATAPALLSTAVPDAVLPHPSMDAYLLHPCSRPALPAYRPSMAIAGNCSATAPALLSTAVPDAVLPQPSMDAYLLHPCSRPALPAYRPSVAIKKAN